MARMGHDSSQAALIYQHATAEADRAIAQALHQALRVDRNGPGKSVGSASKTKGKPGKKSGSKKGKKGSADRDGAGDDRG